MTADPFVESIRRNIELARELLERGEGPEVIGTVAGSAAAKDFWQRQLDRARGAFRTREALSFHEDLPTNQALGLLLLWQRLRGRLRGDRGALVAFVFGEGTRATPFTETDNGQKPAIATFVAERPEGGHRWLPMVELAMRYFVPVQQYLRRSGFEGIVVKWGDEIQVPTRDLSGSDPLFAGADVVRFVSVRAMTEDDAGSKDWVGVGADGGVTAFIPRRPLAEMERLADRGLLQRRDGVLHGGINLGSIALSSVFLDALLEEFSGEVNDPTADRRRRPDLDPQLFTALTIAAIAGERERARAWEEALAESTAMRALDRDLPGVLGRLRGVLERFERRHGRAVKMAAMDFGDQYWGDIGQHARIREFYMSLNDRGATGEIARALAGIRGERDAEGNIVVGATSLSSKVAVRDSVLIDATLAGEGTVEGCVLIGTRAGRIRARDAFDVLGTVAELELEPGSGTYRVVSAAPLRAAAGERWTTLFLPGGQVEHMRAREETDLRDRAATYDVPILGNALSFREAHAAMARVPPEELAARREAAEEEVWARLGVS